MDRIKILCVLKNHCEMHLTTGPQNFSLSLFWELSSLFTSVQGEHLLLGQLWGAAQGGAWQDLAGWLCLSESVCRQSSPPPTPPEVDGVPGAHDSQCAAAPDFSRGNSEGEGQECESSDLLL